jgi:hypothetical protein
MGLLSGLLTLPLAPVRGVVWVAEQIRDQAEQQFYDPVAIRRQLAQVDAALAAGEISEEEAAQLQDLLLDRLWTGTSARAGL